MITNKTRLLTGVALGCVLSTPAAFAEEYSGFYFGVWGGVGSADWPSKTAFDASFSDPWVQGQLDDLADAITAATGDVTTITLASREPSSLDDSPDAWGLEVGYRFNKYFGAEVGYVRLGEVQYDFDGSIDYTDSIGTENFDISGAYRFASAGPTAAAVGFLPLNKYIEFHGKAGIYLADSRQTVRLTDVESKQNFYHERVDSSQTELFAGIGATWNATESLAVRLEYQRFFNVGDDEKTVEENIDVISLGVLFK